MIVNEVSFVYGASSEEWISLYLALYRGEEEVWSQEVPSRRFDPGDVLSWIPIVEADKFYWKAHDVDYPGSHFLVNRKRVDLYVADGEWQEGWMSLVLTGWQKVLIGVAVLGVSIAGVVSIFGGKK